MLSQTEIQAAIVEAHNHLKQQGASVAVLDGMAIAQRMFVQHDIHVQDHDALIKILADNILPPDRYHSDGVVKSLKELWSVPDAR